MLKEAPISFRDIELVKQAFKKRLSTIYHSRVAYPEMKKDTASASAEKEKKEKEAAAGNTDNVITIPEDAGENNEENQSPS